MPPLLIVGGVVAFITLGTIYWLWHDVHIVMKDGQMLHPRLYPVKEKKMRYFFAFLGYVTFFLALFIGVIYLAGWYIGAIV